MAHHDDDATLLGGISAPEPQAAPLDVIAGRYEIQALLGVGGMGRVYRARDRSLDEIVAIKLLRRELVDEPGVLERFRQEVKLARRVTSPHVVRTFDLGEHEGSQFLTMEYVAGRSLARMLAEAPLALTDTLRIARAACVGIAAAHAAGVLHRDLKPDNILVADSGRVAITDFGIALQANAPIAERQMIGTPAYMAPEQVECAEVIGPPADVYAFGTILFEMLTSRRAFQGAQGFAVAIARLHEDPPDPRQHRPLSDPIAELVLRCLAREPVARFADGAALERALAELAEPTRTAPMPLAIAVPGTTSTAIALAGLRAPPELAELASGLAEELVDALSITRALLVRPLSAVRRIPPSDDPRELGRALGVDVVVDGSLRRVGDKIRLAARAIGVADGFQLWANRIDTPAGDLLAVVDELARTIAQALTVELRQPARAPATDPRAIAHYLEGKAALRINWFTGEIAHAITQLELALELAPDQPAIIATVALAYARAGFFRGDDALLAKARVHAERAVSNQPALGEPWLALAAASLYSGRYVDAGAASARATSRSPNLELAQAMLGAILLEIGVVPEAIAHLEASFALDPVGPQRVDLARSYVYAGRWDEARALLAPARVEIFVEITLARFAMWRGERYEIQASIPASAPSDFALFANLAYGIHGFQKLHPEDRTAFAERIRASPPRQRASFAQMFAEWLLYLGDLEAALDQIEDAVAAGLIDTLWFERCPMLAPLHGTPRFVAAARTVEGRAVEVRRAVFDAL